MRARSEVLCIIVVLAIVVLVLGSAVVRLENYRYADSIGMWDEHFSRNDPVKRMQRTQCLQGAITRTHSFWHILYGTKVF